MRLALQGPDVYSEIQPGVPHTRRIEIYRSELYAYYIDGQIVHAAVPSGYFPGSGAFITWRGYSAEQPTLNRWEYIRYGVIAVDGSGDFDSDGAVEERDYAYFLECLCLCGDFTGANSPLNPPPGPGGPTPSPECNCPNVDAGPGCRCADIDGDGDVDCDDWPLLAAAWTDPAGPPPTPISCAPSATVPTISGWGLTILTLLLLAGLTLVFTSRSSPSIRLPDR